MKLRTSSILLVLGVIGIVTVTSYVQFRANRAYDEQRAYRKERADFCQRVYWDLTALVHTPKGQPDFRARIVWHHLDQGITTLCLGRPVVVDPSQAEAEWIKTGSDDGYAGVARQLLDAYQRKGYQP